MPYSNISFQAELPTYEQFYKFAYNNNFSFEEHMASLRQIFDLPKGSPSKLVKEMQKYLPDFSLSKLDRSKEAVAARAELSRTVQDKLMEHHLRRAEYMASSQTTMPKPGSELEYPFRPFLRISNDPEALQFNRELENISKDPDPLKQGAFLLQEFERVRQALGINTPEDTEKLTKRPDGELLENFDQIQRYFALAEVVSLVRNLLTPEQRNATSPFIEPAKNTCQVYMSRMNIIANPYYAQFGTDFFQNRNVGFLAIGLMPQLDKNPSMSKAMTYFDMLNKVHSYRASNLLEEFYTADPSLRDAALSCSGKDTNYHAASSFRDCLPVSALTNDGQMKMLIPNEPVKILTAEAYMKDLSARAARTNKGLLTGSRAFSKMEQTLNEMIKFNQNYTGPKNAQQKNYWDQYRRLNNALIQSATDYLKYKHIEEPFMALRLAGKGKNQREQLRLDVAFSLLNMAQGQIKALDFGFGQAVELENVDLADLGKKKSDSEEILLENLKAPKGFLLDEAENNAYYSGNEKGAAKQALLDYDARYEKANAESMKENKLELEIVLQFDAAKLRLSRYSNGDSLPGSKQVPDDEAAYKAQVTDDLNRMVFRYALEVEDMALDGEDGVLWQMLNAQGYEKSLREFSKLTADTNVFARVGLKDTQPENVKAFLDQNGWKQAAKLLMSPNQKMTSSQDQEPLAFDKIAEVEQRQQKTEIARPLNPSESSSPMTMPF